MMLIPNDSILQLVLVLLVLLLLYDIASHDDHSDVNKKKNNKKRRSTKRTRRRASLRSPIAIGRRVQMDTVLVGPINIMNVYMPCNNSITGMFVRTEASTPTAASEIRHDSAVYTDSRLSVRASRDSLATTSSCNVHNFIIDNNQRTAFQLKLLPYLPGCEADSPAAAEMIKLFPDDNIIDILRFLIARKGDVSLAADMFRKSKEWHSRHLPLRRSPTLDAVLALKCFFFHKNARDGSPLLYFRGALYDHKLGAENYILTAAHCIDYVLRKSNQISVTVFVHSAAVPGASNQNPDMDFMKGFASIMSDNFPERMKRLILFPFPWYGRAIWSCVRMFVDKRSQDKIFLIPSSGYNELTEIIDPNEVPLCVGGNDTTEIFALESSIQ